MKDNIIKSNFKDNYTGYRFLPQFNPKGKSFMFHMSKYDCYKQYSGKCSLTLDNRSSILSNTYARENDVCYCINLVESLIANGLNREILLTKFSCGHYAFTDGQHRVCSASRDGLIVPVYVQEADTECYFCYWRKKSLKFRIKTLLKRNDIFIQKL